MFVCLLWFWVISALAFFREKTGVLYFKFYENIQNHKYEHLSLFSLFKHTVAHALTQARSVDTIKKITNK